MCRLIKSNPSHPKVHRSSTSWLSTTSSSSTTQVENIKGQLAQAPSSKKVRKDGNISEDDDTNTTVYAGDSSFYGQTTASQFSFWTETTDAGRPSDLGQTPTASLYETRESHEFPGDASGKLYRSCLTHNFHPSLTCPLWSPSQVRIGDVGYIHPLDRTFITLLNAFEPTKSSGGLITDIRPIHLYGNTSLKARRQGGTRFAKGIKSILTFGKKDSIKSILSAPLSNGVQSATLFTESVMFRHMKNTSPAKKWLGANIDHVLAMSSKDGHLGKEKKDILLVTSTLEAKEYALFVNHAHPDGTLNFNIFSSPTKGSPWGRFSTTTDLSVSQGQPEYRFASRISYYDEQRKRDTLLFGFVADNE